jgi:hypothetical protein
MSIGNRGRLKFPASVLKKSSSSHFRFSFWQKEEKRVITCELHVIFSALTQTKERTT